MRIFWWQGGLHIEPETNDERRWLGQATKILESLEVADLRQRSKTGNIDCLGDDHPTVHEKL